MSETGISKKKIKIVPISDGAAHLQNEVVSYKCYVCHCDEHEDMAMLRVGEKKLANVCLTHRGVIQEFLRQFKIVPLGYVQTIV